MKSRDVLEDMAEQAGDRGPGRWAWLAGAFWLFYLFQPLQRIANRESGAAEMFGFLTVGLFAASYLAFFGLLRRAAKKNQLPVWQRVSYLALMLTLCLLMIPTAGQTAFTGLVYIASVAMLLLDLRVAIAFVVLLFAGAEISLRVVPGWSDNGSYGLAIVLGALAVYALRRAGQRGIELERARREMADLAVQEERNRFARDLHDILGHSLTVITVKAELAGKLIEASPARAAAEVADVESLARAALADVRAAVAGYRELSLAGELVAAKTALKAAEIKPDLPTTVDEVPEENRELFAWVVREGVTNVLRHSGAKRCRIKFDARQIEVLDDGKGPTPGGGASGHGLMGLRERADQAGASVQVGQAPGGGFRLAVRVGP
ncbi:sensor histidine kinase [Kribbella sp. NPDC055071]